MSKKSPENILHGITPSLWM